MEQGIAQITYINKTNAIATLRDIDTGQIFHAKIPFLYFHPARGEFAGYMPEPGTFVAYVVKDGVARILHYFPHSTHELPAFIDPYYRPEYGSFFVTTRARNFVAVRRSGTIELHATPACTRLYMQRENTIIQHFWNMFDDTPCMDYNYEYDYKNKRAWWRQHLWRWKDEKEKKYWWIESPKDKADETWLYFKGEDQDKKHKTEGKVFNPDSSLDLHLEFTPQKTIDITLNKDENVLLICKNSSREAKIQINPSDTNIYIEVKNGSQKSQLWLDEKKFQVIVNSESQASYQLYEDNGHIKIGNMQGSFIEFTTEGDIIIKSARNIHLNPEG